MDGCQVLSLIRTNLGIAVEAAEAAGASILSVECFSGAWQCTHAIS